MIDVIIPDGVTKQFEPGVTALDIAESIDKKMAKKVLAVKINDEVKDATLPIYDNCTLKFLTWEDKEGKATFWHSSAHLMAEALEYFYPGVKFGVGPDIENGFYYDIDPGDDRTISEEDFPKIEKKMMESVNQNNPFIRKEVSKQEALEMFTQKGDEYKIELINELEDETISIYTHGNFVDLCRGPHLPSTRFIRAIKLLSVAGAYWRGDEKNKQLTRIYGVSFPDKKELHDYLQMLEEAKKRDHRKVGKELELFTFSDLVGKGFPLYLPKGATLRRVLERFIVDEELRRGYQHVYTPHMANKKIYEVSGHWNLYQDSMYPPMKVSDEDIVLRPMACPHHFQIFDDRLRSYRELPIRIAELASQFRKEQSGELSGLIRVLTFTLADSHIFCRPDQVAAEFKGAIELIQYTMKCLGIESIISYRASLRDEAKEKYVDNPEMWEQSQKFLLDILDEVGLEYTKAEGHAAFYGPKLDVQMKNIWGKEDTAFTVQIDFALPERFNISYIDEDGQKKRPVVVHRSSIGSLERTIAFLIEFYNGAFPLWLSPVQMKILNITDSQLDYVLKIEKQLIAAGFRVEKDVRNETFGKKLREARLEKVPYILIIGDKEMQENHISVRNRDTRKQNTISVETFIHNIQKEQAEYAIELHAENG